MMRSYLWYKAHTPLIMYIAHPKSEKSGLFNCVCRVNYVETVMIAIHFKRVLL